MSACSLRAASSGAATRCELAQRLRLAGPRALDDAEALQVASHASPGAIEAALAEFGSLAEVLAADRDALARLLSPAQADRLALVHDLARRLLQSPLKARPLIAGTSAASDYLRGVLAGRSREAFHVLFLDKRNRLLRDEVMVDGTIDHAPVYPREVVRRALELAASALILAHNHPGGDPQPSTADIEITRQVVAAAAALRIAVHDHLLVAGERVVRFRALGLL